MSFLLFIYANINRIYDKAKDVHGFITTTMDFDAISGVAWRIARYRRAWLPAHDEAQRYSHLSMIGDLVNTTAIEVEKRTSRPLHRCKWVSRFCEQSEHAGYDQVQLTEVSQSEHRVSECSSVVRATKTSTL